MRGMDIADTREKLGVYSDAGLLSGSGALPKLEGK
jgi:hypothetical protein